jgi:hypothetical protein
MTQIRNRHRRDRRESLLALLIGGPAVILALGIVATEAWRWSQPNSSLFAAPAAASFTDAIASDDVLGAYEFIRGGQDPNALISVRHMVLTGGRRVEVRPLLWAVATQSEGAVAMLLGFGARLDAVTKREAVCLAEQLGRADIVRLLQLGDPEASREPCPPRQRSDGSLLPIR